MQLTNYVPRRWAGPLRGELNRIPIQALAARSEIAAPRSRRGAGRAAGPRGWDQGRRPLIDLRA
jgi:hypothetical protein